MSDNAIVQNEPVAALRNIRIQIRDLSGNPVNGLTLGGGSGLALLIAKAGGNMAASAGATLTNITGGNSTDGLYLLRLAIADCDTVGVLNYELTTGSSATTIALTTGSITIDPPKAMRYNLAQGGGATSITLDSGASSSNNEYAGAGIDCTCRIVSGTGAGQTRIGTGYVGSTKVLSVTPNWATSPDGTSVFELQPYTGQSAIIATVSGNVNGNVSGTVTGLVTPIANIAAQLPTSLDGNGNMKSGVLTIADGAISATTLASNTVTAAKIAANAITSSQIADNAITSTKLAAGAITSAAFAAGAIATAAIADGAITAAKIAANAITSSQIADNAITVAKVADNFITSAKLATSAVNAIRDSILLYALDGARTVRGVLTRMNAFIKGKAAGLDSNTATFYMEDNTTKAMEFTQDTLLGTRSAASTVNGD